jgi:hypothetical protein
MQSHVVILPYFCDEEISRFLRIVSRLMAMPQRCRWSFLLAASPRTTPSKVLEDACRRVAPVKSFQCPTRVFGYPQGPTAMFWDCMDYLAENYPDDGGFGLWLESDMAPVKYDWLDRLEKEWSGAPNPVLMGCYVPKVYKQRLFRGKKLLLDDHVNGGACYAKTFAARLPCSAREGVFDMVTYREARQVGEVLLTRQIDFSDNRRVRRDVLDPGKVLLHGYMQDKNQFIEACLAPVRTSERRTARFHSFLDWSDTLRRKVRVWLVRKGQQAMYENMLLAKRRHSETRRAA